MMLPIIRNIRGYNGIDYCLVLKKDDNNTIIGEELIIRVSEICVSAILTKGICLIWVLALFFKKVPLFNPNNNHYLILQRCNSNLNPF